MATLAATRLLRRWVTPSPSIVDPDIRRRAALHSSLLLVLLFIAAGVFLAEEALRGFRPVVDAGHVVLWLGLVVLALDYGLSRTRHYTVSATLTVLTTSTLVWRLWAVDAATDPARGTLYFLAVPLILAALLLPVPYTLAFIGLTLVSILLVPTWAQQLGASIHPDLVFDLVSYVVVISGLTIAGAILLERSRKQLALQTVELSRQTEATEAANRSLRELEATRIQFLNQAAHDLANPLSPVKIQMDLIRRAAEKHPEVPIKENLRIVQRNLGLFEHLLQDIRDLAKMEAGKLQLEPTNVRLHEVITSVCEFYQPVAEEAGVRLEVAVPEDLEVCADGRRLEQVVNNLVANAIRFSPSWSSVRIEARPAHEEKVEVSVADKGRGLVPDEVSRLFRPFSQVHDRSEVKERGTGLGLYICKGFVEAHGGRIWVESPGRGRGSTFRFTLPARPAPNP